MPNAQRGRSTPKNDRRLDLVEAGRRVGYASETLRKMMKRDGNPPPLQKAYGGSWFVWQRELDAWAAERNLEIKDEAS